MTATRLSARNLVWAYANGIFPMGRSATSTRIDWYDPDPRGVLPLDAFHVPRSLRKTLRRSPYEVRVDGDFAATMAGCAARGSTWINDEIVRGYCELHEAGLAHSVECWRGGKLVGGLYGVHLKAAFFGESMFAIETDASKVALVHLVARLRAGGFLLLDTQMATDHMIRFGAVEIPRAEYRQRLAAALDGDAVFYREAGAEVLEALQSMTQTS
ncbi:MAG: leucyl/phenylalanyl-tRNA--protein transferase [Rhodospirillales bacterium]|nr:leucyl/phenylalanyl-tRNA--protein transferase [Rhodospirillales bacterium]